MSTTGPSSRIWKQEDSWGKHFTLTTLGGSIASLQLASGFGTRAEAVHGNHHWSFKRTGFWRPKVTVRIAGREEDIALFTPQWMYAGHLVVQQQRHYAWKHIHLFSFGYQWETFDGTPLVSFPNETFTFSLTSRVEMTDAGSRSPDLPLLETLGWYLMILMARDGAVVVGS